MGLLDRDALLAGRLTHERVPVPEFQGEVIVSSLTLPERLAFEKWVAARPEDSNDFLLGAVLFGVVDEAGTHLLSAADEALIVGSWPASVVVRVGSAASRLNRLDAEVEVAKGESSPSRSSGT